MLAQLAILSKASLQTAKLLSQTGTTLNVLRSTNIAVGSGASVNLGDLQCSSIIYYLALVKLCSSGGAPHHSPARAQPREYGSQRLFGLMVLILRRVHTITGVHSARAGAKLPNRKLQNMVPLTSQCSDISSLESSLASFA